MNRRTGQTTRYVMALKNDSNMALVVRSADERQRIIRVYGLNKEQANRIFSQHDKTINYRAGRITGTDFSVYFDSIEYKSLIGRPHHERT